MPTSFSIPVVPAGAKVLREAALWSRAEVVGEPDRGDRGDPRLERADDPPHERQPQAAVVGRERAEGEEDVTELARPVREPGEIAPGRPVAEGKHDLLDLEAGRGRVVRHAHLAAEAPGDRKARTARLGGDGTLPGERLERIAAGPEAEQPPRGSLDDAEPTALPFREGGDRQVGAALDERPHVADEIGVAEEQRSLGRSTLGERQGLPLPAPREPEDAGARSFGLDGGAVAGAVVGDDHLRLRELLAQRGDGRADPALLVAGRDQDGDRLSHS